MKVAAINDLSGFGKCSLVADMTVLAAMGIQCCPIPTATLSAQTGYPSYYFKDLTGIIPEYLKEWEKQGETFDGIITGFMMSSLQAINSLEFILRMRSEGTKVLVDPVMGDDGRTYRNFSKELLETIRRMVKEADIITPNLTELILLAGEDMDKVTKLPEKELTEEIYRLSMLVGGDKGKIVVVTGIPLSDTKAVSNYVFDNGEGTIITSESNGIHYSGTGDLFAAAFLGEYLRGGSATSAANLASQFILASIKDTPKDVSPNAGTEYEKNLKMLMR